MVGLPNRNKNDPIAVKTVLFSVLNMYGKETQINEMLMNDSENTDGLNK